MSLFDMYKYHAELFVETARCIGSLLQTEGAISREGMKNWTTSLLEFQKHCEKAELRVSAGHITNIAYEVETDPDLTDEQFRQKLRAFVDSLVLELDGILFLHVPFIQAGFYSNPQAKWEQIIARFPKTLRDVEEAQKCLALSRYTATVFHSLQIVEVGLIELGTFINVNDPTSGWTSVAQRLKKIIDTKYQDLDSFEKANRPFLEQLQGTVEALKNAWRNKISHAHGKLTVMTGQEFHPDVAEEILSATRAFMRRLAEGLPPANPKE